MSEGKHIEISRHAINRFRQRFGRKRMSADKVKKEIKKALQNDLICVVPAQVYGKQYVCRDFVVVMDGYRVITVHSGSGLPYHVKRRMSTAV